MRMGSRWGMILIACIAALAAVSCAKKEPAKTAGGADTTAGKALSYVSHEINFGVYFDEEGTKRTLKLGKGDKEITAHVIVTFPEGMKIAAAEYRLVLPEGLALGSDKAYQKIIAHLGTFEEGISETFDCTAGPRLLLHTFTLEVTGRLSNAEIAIMPDQQNKFLGVALCEEGNDMIAASSFKAVVNPAD